MYSNELQWQDVNKITEKSSRSQKPQWSYKMLAIICLMVVILAELLYVRNICLRFEREITSANGLRLLPTIPLLGSGPTKYLSKDEEEADRAWKAIEGGHGIVAVDAEYKDSRELPDTSTHPDGSGRFIYVIEAYHAIHCLKWLRQHYKALLKPGSTAQIDWDIKHDFHCLDSLRQYVMCHPDDALLHTSLHKDVGVNQTRQCSSWDDLRDWATSHTACYHDAPWGKGLPRWEMCDGGEDGLPRGSLL